MWLLRYGNVERSLRSVVEGIGYKGGMQNVQGKDISFPPKGKWENFCFYAHPLFF